MMMLPVATAPRSGYVPTSPAMSSSPAPELPVVPLELRVPVVATDVHCTGGPVA